MTGRRTAGVEPHGREDWDRLGELEEISVAGDECGIATVRQEDEVVAVEVRCLPAPRAGTKSPSTPR